MNNIFKRTLSLLLVLVMCISLLPASALADDEVETEVVTEDVVVSQNDEEAPIPSPTSTPKEVETPDASDTSTYDSSVTGTGELIWPFPSSHRVSSTFRQRWGTTAHRN